jgi:alkanesulfonate monooxygenase SsuD/methylene tetrahydromethanopterin reductase-like flavin-dependent oxidoreductase (luciferase family)
MDEMLSVAVVGSPDTVRRDLERFIDRTGADELILTSQIFDHAARLRSFEIAAHARDDLARTRRSGSTEPSDEPRQTTLQP